MSQRRGALKIIGAIGTTCAFPYSADELYGQHEHGSDPAQAAHPKPAFFNTAEFAAVSALAETIIPETDTPGAIAAGVPAYIDYVVNSNNQWKKLFREGLAHLEKQAQARFNRPFADLTSPQREELVAPLCKAADAVRPALNVGRNPTRARDTQLPLPARFFKAFKSMTADGYFTSKAGLVQTLGYKGNTVLPAFPSCEG